MHHSIWARKHLLIKILQFLCFCLFERLPRGKFPRIVHVCFGILSCTQSANSSLFEHLNRQRHLCHGNESLQPCREDGQPQLGGTQRVECHTPTSSSCCVHSTWSMMDVGQSLFRPGARCSGGFSSATLVSGVIEAVLRGAVARHSAHHHPQVTHVCETVKPCTYLLTRSASVPCRTPKLGVLQRGETLVSAHFS